MMSPRDYDWTQDDALGLEKIAIPFMGNIMRGAGAVGKGVGGQLLKGVGTHALGGAAAGAALGGITAPEGETMSRMGRGALIGGAAGAGLGGFRGLSQLSAIGKAMPGAVGGASQLAGGVSQAAGGAARAAGGAQAAGARQAVGSLSAGMPTMNAAGKPIIDVTATSAGQAAAGLPGRAPVKGLLGPGPGGVSPGVSSQPLSRAPQGGATRYHPDLGGSVNTVPSSGQVTQLPGQKAGWGARLKNWLGVGGQPPAAAAQVGAQMGGNAVGQAGQAGVTGLVSGGTPAMPAKWGHVTALRDLGLHPFNG